MASRIRAGGIQELKPCTLSVRPIVCTPNTKPGQPPNTTVRTVVVVRDGPQSTLASPINPRTHLIGRSLLFCNYQSEETPIHHHPSIFPSSVVFIHPALSSSPELRSDASRSCSLVSPWGRRVVQAWPPENFPEHLYFQHVPCLHTCALSCSTSSRIVWSCRVLPQRRALNWRATQVCF